MDKLAEYTPIITQLCKKHKVKSLYVFGSILTDRFNDESDIDLIVDFQRMPLMNYADNYFELKYSLENMFHRSVDLLEEKGIRNPYFRRNIEQRKQLLY